MSNASLQGAHDFVLNNPQFNQTINVAAGSGLKKLLKASMPEAFHDSGARDPPRCHPGTRLDYIGKITSWGTDTSDHSKHILWMRGAAGVGKTAVAQSCAELLAERNQLGASFFFSRPNNTDDSKHLFPSLSYQITTISDVYADILDRKLQRNPTLPEKSLPRQFHELLVKPLEELREGRNDMKDYVIIIDGLDECAGIRAQQEIIETVAKSVQDGTTPFRWAFFSRPESHIIASFTADHVRPVTSHLELPVSREIDHEILCYLVSEFDKVRKEHGLPSSWPAERDLGTLVDLSAGLFIYASTVIRFVGERNSSGPVEQLRLVLFFTKQGVSNTGSSHPLSELDLFYTLIMRCVPSNILPMIRNILLLYNSFPRFPKNEALKKIYVIAEGLNLSKPQIRNACASLRSVLEFKKSMIKFYHASFMDFLRDPNRSKEFCIYGDCLDVARQELLECLNRTHTQNIENSTFKATWLPRAIYDFLVGTFFALCQHPRPLAPLTAAGLVKFEFRALLRLCVWHPRGGAEINPEALRQNIPVEFRDKVVRRSRDPVLIRHKPKGAKPGDGPYILGQGKNRVVWWKIDGLGTLHPYPSILQYLVQRYSSI